MCHPVTLLLGIHNAVNPLLHIGHYSVRMAKISILKEGIIKKKSNERRVYESVDDSILS